MARTPNTVSASSCGKGVTQQRNREDDACHDGRQAQGQAQLRPDQSAHQRVADLGLLLNLDTGTHHPRAAPVREHDPLPSAAAD